MDYFGFGVGSELRKLHNLQKGEQFLPLIHLQNEYTR